MNDDDRKAVDRAIQWLSGKDLLNMVEIDDDATVEETLGGAWVEARVWVPAADGCEGCDGSGIRPEAPNHAGAEIPPGFVVVERCDACARFDTDLEAARAYGREAVWLEGPAGPGREVAVCRAPD